MVSDLMTQSIIGAAIEVHRLLGPGLLENIYEDAFCIELELRQITYERQVLIDLQYKGHHLKGQRVDLIVQNSVVLELKALPNVPEFVLAQVLCYLKATGLKRGLIINFNASRLVDGIKRVSL